MPTPAQVADLNRETSAHALLGFVTITGPSLPGGVLRYVTDVLPYVWAGATFQPIGGLDLPQADDSDAEPRISITLPNIERRIGETLRRSPERLRVALTLLSSADFDLTANPRTEIGTATTIYSLSEFETVDATYDDVAAEITLILRDYAQEPFGLYAAPTIIPGVYR